MKKRLIVGIFIYVAAVLSFAAMGKEEARVELKAKAQLAILLDTSNSMDGLIEQAKSQLWQIVNQFATATAANGQKPEVEVALYQYGTPSLGAETGFIRQILPLTADLDKVSEELFSLKTNGGDEYCGAVIQAASSQLQWSPSKNDYKAIFIAGNEPFTQGNVDFHNSCKAAVSHGIIVNTIFCGVKSEGVQTFWKDGADLADGSFFSIDQNQKIVNVATPFDNELATLNVQLNETYLAYGSNGRAGQDRQMAQDVNAVNVSASVAASRVVTKASSNYKNSSWDLVDAVKEKQVDLAALKDEDLPKELKKMPLEERKAHVEEKMKQRADVQEKIGQLSRGRDAYVAAERVKTSADSKTNTLDAAIINAIRTQAARANFRFEAGEKGK